MTRQYGMEYPERHLMSTISDLLGIPHFSTSNGGTVRTDFLRAVADAIGADYDHRTTKDELIRLVWETARKEEMPSDRFSVGGTVTNLVLFEIAEGISRDLDDGEPSGRRDGILSSDPSNGEGSDLQPFDPSNLGDDRTRLVREAAIREGQDRFRRAVLDAYGSRCAISGTSIPMVLEAAHIAPCRGPAFNNVTNGLCLRADFHILFDRGQMTVSPRDHTVAFSRSVKSSPEYSTFEGGRLFLPSSREAWPSTPALAHHEIWAQKIQG